MHLDLSLLFTDGPPDYYTLFTQEDYADPTIQHTDLRSLAVTLCCFCVTNALTGMEETISAQTKLSVQEVQNLLKFCANKLNTAQPKN